MENEGAQSSEATLTGSVELVKGEEMERSRLDGSTRLGCPLLETRAVMGSE